MSEETVMIVEDDEDLVHMLEYNLKNKGYQTLSALNGFDARELIEAEKPHLILLDILLPGMDGWQICETLRNHEQSDIADIPIIMLTALSSPDEKLKGIALGADDYISKPFSIKEVLLRVHRLLQRETAKKQLKEEIKTLRLKESRRTDFQDMLFHELRNQLTIIGGYSRRISDRSEKPFETYRHYGGIIQRCSRSLTSLTDQVILLTRLADGDCSLPVETVSLEQIIRDIIRDYTPQLEQKSQQLQFQQTGSVPALQLNPTALRLALSNLVENAVRYSCDGSEIIIRLGQSNGKGLTVEVEDSGPGIPECDRDSIFNRFYRGKHVKDQSQGTDLGLYISKTLIEAMGGTVHLDPANGNGSCFVVRL
ncbi:MAG: response regulator [Deltaproteobacteria bacterium]|nr:response regulator [Deltaproteobacteria bacterium]